MSGKITITDENEVDIGAEGAGFNGNFKFKNTDTFKLDNPSERVEDMAILQREDEIKRKAVNHAAKLGGVSGVGVGAGVGAAVGTVIGAVVGSVVPGPGTAAGIAAGAGIGAGIGGGIGGLVAGGAGTALGAGVGAKIHEKKKNKRK